MKSLLLTLALVSFPILLDANTKMTEEEARDRQLKSLCQEHGSIFHCMLRSGYKCEKTNEKNIYLCKYQHYDGKLTKLLLTEKENGSWLVEKIE